MHANRVNCVYGVEPAPTSSRRRPGSLNRDRQSIMSLLSSWTLLTVTGIVHSYVYLPDSPAYINSADVVCRSLPYRTAYIGSRCFIAVNPDDKNEKLGRGESVCRDILQTTEKTHFKNYDIKAVVATVECDALFDELRRSMIIRPNVKYEVKEGPNGDAVVTVPDKSYKNTGSLSGVLCEFTSKEKCSSGYELFHGYCYKVFDNEKTPESAQMACEDDGGSLATIRDDNVNRYVASLAAQSNHSRAWIGTLRDGSVWSESETKEPASYYRWQLYDSHSKAKFALMQTNIERRDTKWFGYWLDSSSQRFPFVCAKKAASGTPELELIPDYERSYKA